MRLPMSLAQAIANRPTGFPRSPTDSTRARDLALAKAADKPRMERDRDSVVTVSRLMSTLPACRSWSS